MRLAGEIFAHSGVFPLDIVGLLQQPAPAKTAAVFAGRNHIQILRSYDGFHRLSR